MDIKVITLIFVFLAGVSFSFCWNETQLPWKPSSERGMNKKPFYKFWKQVVLDRILPTDYDAWFKQFKMRPPLLESPVGANLSCPPTSSFSVPKSVHRLTPADIKVVAAIGDSWTAGFGARSRTLQDLFVEFRDVSWSIGGHGQLEEATTLPNILKKYNPNIFGFSEQITPVGDFKEKLSNFNFAKSGATVEDASEIVEDLVSMMKEAELIDFKRDWKLITLFVGSADLCRSCIDTDYSPRNFAKKISKTLYKIREKIPRVFINLVQVLDVSKMNALGGPYCQAFHRKICPCASGSPSRRMAISRAAKQYSMLLERIAKSPRFQNDPNFTVVLQPFLSRSQLPLLANGKVDRSYLAPDCYHPSTKGHAAMARALWNNMLQPVGEKSTSWESNDGLNCPRPGFPYFFTNQNTRQYYSNRPPVNFVNQKNGPGIHKSVQTSENEHERKEKTGAENEKEFKTTAVLVTSGLVIAAVAAGIVVHVIRKRNRVLKGNSSERPNYKSFEENETLM
eukprot:gene15099-16657_t